METTIKKKIELAIELFLWAKSHKLYSEIKIQTEIYGVSEIVEFNCQAQSYKYVHEFSRLFKIGFNKSESASEECLDYRGETKDMRVFLYAIRELPPFCKVEYETIKIPEMKAYTKTIAKVVCK